MRIPQNVEFFFFFKLQVALFHESSNALQPIQFQNQLIKSHYVSGIVLRSRHPKVYRKWKIGVYNLDGEKQIDGPLKRMPRGDATKFLPEKGNWSIERRAFNCLVDMGLFAGKVAFTLGLECRQNGEGKAEREPTREREQKDNKVDLDQV